MKLLIVGGYGTFGGRLVELLEDDSRLEIVVAGRSGSKAAAFCSSRQDAVASPLPAASQSPAAPRVPAARLVPALFDRNGDVGEQLRMLAPDILVDASGPFQAYGEGRYCLIQACIAQGVHYLDLADGSEFVAGVRAFDAAARAAGVYVLSGVSSFPVLTAAVVRHLSRGMTRVASIKGGIAPSPYAGVGENVIRAIAGYAGQPVALRRSGAPATGYPFTETLRFTIAPPGRIPLKNILFSLVDVPDLRALAELWPETDEIWMGAGPVPEVLHRALSCLAWLVRWRVLRSLSPLARLMFVVTNRLRWGEHRGGMFVVVGGTDASGQTVNRTWHLLAEGDDGPFIPSMAIEAIVRKALDGQQPVQGARAAVNDLELADYERLFANRTIYVGTRDEPAVSRNDTPAVGRRDEPATNLDARVDNTTPLFARLLGNAWQQLPAAVCQLHTFSSASLAEGRCNIDRGPGVGSNWTASLFGFPKAANDLSVSVRFEPQSGTERWTRTFGTQIFSSTLRAGHGRTEHLLCERIGLFDFEQALVVEGERLRLVLRRWSLFGIALPSWLAPHSNSYETEHDGRFHFHVEISHPWVGLIVRYSGWLSAARGVPAFR